jgi:hypothetical protein
MWWEDYTATVSGSVFVKVPCEHCGNIYYYQLTRQVSGEGSSLLSLDNEGARQRAMQRADDRLRSELEASRDPVPCPKCGLYQSDMVPMLRSQYGEALKALGILVLFVIPLILAYVFLKNRFIDGFAGNQPPINWIVPGILMGALAAMGIGLMMLRFCLAWRYDPNDPSEVNTAGRIGQEKAITEELMNQIQPSPPAMTHDSMPSPPGNT